MSKTITLQELPAPTNPSATPVAGGSLVASTTYFYKVVAVGPGTSYNQGDSAMWWASPASVEVSATTDATNKSIKLYWDNHADASVWMLFRTTISGDYEVYNSSTKTWHSHLIRAGSNARTYGLIASQLTVSGSGYEWTDDGSKTLAKHPIVDVGVPCFEIEGGDVNDPITPMDLYDWAVTNGKTYCISSWDYCPGLALPIAIKIVASVRQPQPGTTPLYFSIPDRTYFLQIWGKLWFDADSYFNIGSNDVFPTKGGIWQRIGSYAWYCGTHGNIEWYDMAMLPPPSYVYNNLDSYCMGEGTMFQFSSRGGITNKIYQSIIDPKGRGSSGRAIATELDVQGSKVYWQGANVGSANANIDDCKIQNYVSTHYGRREGTIKNSTFTYPSTYDFKGYNLSNTEDQVTHLINITFANDPAEIRSSISSSYSAWQIFLIKYEINIKVIDKDNNIIQNALVSLKDKNGYGAIWIDTDNLNEDISIGETEWTVVDGSKFTAGDYIRVNMETIKIESVSGNYLTVSRAQEGTIDRQYNTGQKIFLRHDTLETNASGEITTIPAIKTIAYNRAEVAGSAQAMDVTTDLSPCTLEVRKAGYKTYKTTFTLDKKIDWKITLKRISINVDGEVIN